MRPLVDCYGLLCSQGRAFQQHAALSPIPGQCSCTLERLTCLNGSSELDQKITANAREQVVSVHRPFRGKRIDQVEAWLARRPAAGTPCVRRRRSLRGSRRPSRQSIRPPRHRSGQGWSVPTARAARDRLSSVDRSNRGLALPDDAQEPPGPLDRFVLVPLPP